MTQTYHLGLYDSKPYGWLDEKGDYQGITLQHTLDVVNYVSPNASITVILGNTKRLTNGLSTGHIDLLISAWDPGLKEHAVKIGPILDVNIELWRSARNIVEDPFTGNLAVHYKYDFLYDRLDNASVVTSVENNSALELIASGRIDGVVSTAVSLCYNARESGLDFDAFDRYPLRSIPVYLWINNQSELAKDLSQWELAVESLKNKIGNSLLASYCSD